MRLSGPLLHGGQSPGDRVQRPVRANRDSAEQVARLSRSARPVLAPGVACALVTTDLSGDRADSLPDAWGRVSAKPRGLHRRRRSLRCGGRHEGFQVVKLAIVGSSRPSGSDDVASYRPACSVLKLLGLSPTPCSSARQPLKARTHRRATARRPRRPSPWPRLRPRATVSGLRHRRAVRRAVPRGRRP